MDKNAILKTQLTTPLGTMIACATNKGLCLLEFAERKILQKQFNDLRRLLKTQIVDGENDFIQQAHSELSEYFSGQRKTFDVELHTPGTAFQNQAWAALLKIPYGQTSTYQLQAQKINRPAAVRAVAAANGHNRIAIILPCHRVIGKNGQLTGYGGGLERKKWLLEHEQSIC